MTSRSEARAARQKLDFEHFEQTKQRIIDRVVGPTDVPRIAQLPDEIRLTPRVGTPLVELDVPEQPRIASEGTRLGAAMTWCVRKGDIEGEWSWREPRSWTPEEWASVIGPAFGQFERLTWGELQRQASGEGHLMHHEQLVGTLVDEAQWRWLELGLEEFDTAFRFRLGNTRRFWGFIVQGHFFGVWWERSHKLYPTG